MIASGDIRSRKALGNGQRFDRCYNSQVDPRTHVRFRGATGEPAARHARNSLGGP